jgi:predicted O-methyltransferase YrrM
MGLKRDGGEKRGGGLRGVVFCWSRLDVVLLQTPFMETECFKPPDAILCVSMANDLRTSVGLLKKERGSRAFQGAFEYVWKQYLFFPFLPFAMVRLKGTRSVRDPGGLVDFTYAFSRGLMRPLQVRGELVELVDSVVKERPKVVLEIGTSLGGTLFLFCHAAAEDAVLISVDLPKGPWGGGYSRARVPLYRSFCREGQRLHLIQGDSHSGEIFRRVQGLLKGRQVDLLFIDGDHSYEGVKRDFEVYSPLVRQNGLIVFHDIIASRYAGCQVDRLWGELEARYQCRRIVMDPGQQWAGIGVLRK